MDKVIGNCSKHPGQNFINCPLCEIERQKKLSKTFWNNVQKDVERVNPAPEGVTADPKDEEIARLKELLKGVHEAGVGTMLILAGVDIDTHAEEIEKSWQQFKTEHKL